MNKKLKFIWIDDTHQRSRSADSLSINLKVMVNFISLDQKNIQDEIDEVFKANDVDLILIDHKLSKSKSEIIKTGSTVAELIREKLPECPMVCVTAVDIDHEISHAQRDLYDYVYSFAKLESHYEKLKAIAESYKFIAHNRPTDQNDIIKLLKAPDSENDRLLTILPTNLKDNFSDKSLLQKISKWVSSILLSMPGFLYDELWAATLIGLKPTSFNKVSGIFQKATYKGVFSDPSVPKYWASAVKEILYDKVKDDKFRKPWELGYKLKGCSEKDISRCHACGQPFPETVAFIDELSLKQKPMHLRCTTKHSKFQQMLFFDEIRVMKGAEN